MTPEVLFPINNDIQVVHLLQITKDKYLTSLIEKKSYVLQ
jgi:hypothetical protein